VGRFFETVYISDVKCCVRNATVKLFADNTNLFVHGKTLRGVFDKAYDSIILLIILVVEKSCYSLF